MIHNYNMDMIAQVSTTVLHLEEENTTQKQSKREKNIYIKRSQAN